MSQPTNGPSNGPGSHDTNVHGDDPKGSPGNVSKRPLPAQGDGRDSRSAGDADASRRAAPSSSHPDVPSDKTRADTWNAGGSRSPGSLPDAPKTGETNRDPKMASSAAKQSSPPTPHTPIPSSPQGRVPELPKPTMHLGIREAKGDGKTSLHGPSESPAKPVRTDENPAPDIRPGTGSSPLRTEPPSTQRDLTSPQDPPRTGKVDPVQPGRPALTPPSRVAEPTVGASGASSDSATTSE